MTDSNEDTAKFMYKLLRMMQYTKDRTAFPVSFNSFEKEVIGFLNEQNVGTKLSVFYPSPFPDLPLALTLFFTYCFFDDALVLLIGDEVSKYREIYLNTSINGAPLSDLYGLATISRNGAIKPIRLLNSKGAFPKNRVLMSGNWQHFPENDKVGAVILIAPLDYYSFQNNLNSAVDWADKIGVKNLIIVDFIPDLRRRIYYSRHGLLIKEWSKPTIKKILSEQNNLEPSPYSMSIKDFQDYQKEPKRVNVFLNFDQIDSRLIELDNAYNTINTPKLRSNYYLSTIIQSLHEFTRRLETLVSPLEFAESCYSGQPHSLSAKGLIDVMNKYNSDELPSEFLRARAIAQNLYDELKTIQTPKTSQIIREIEKAIGERKRLLIVCSGHKGQYEGLLKYLSSLTLPLVINKLNEKGIFIIHIKDLPKLQETNFDYCIFTSYLNSKFTWLMFKYICPEIEILQYKSEQKMFSLLDKLYDFGDISFQSVRIDSSSQAESLSIESLLGEGIDNYALEVEDIVSKDWKELVKQGTTLERGYELLLEDNQGAKKTLYVKDSNYLQVFKEPSEVKHVKASKLKEGDVVLLVNNSVKGSLTDIILNKARQNPDMMSLEITAKLWIALLKKDMRENGDKAEDLLQKMQAEGSKIKTSVAIRFWVKGWVIGPQDASNIQIIAKIYNDEELMKNASDIAIAIKKFRHIRKKLILWLRSVIFSKSYEKEEVSNALSEDWQIYPEDFIGSISYFRVVAVNQIDKIPANKFGRVLD